MPDSFDKGERQLDELLDAAMASYSEPADLDAEAIAGRVLARVDKAAQPVRGWRQWIGAASRMRTWLMAGAVGRRVAVPALAALLVVAGVFAWRDARHVATTPPATVAHVEPHAAQPVGAPPTATRPARSDQQTQAASRSVRGKLAQRRPQQNSKPQIFPVPAPLSDEERMLLAAARQPPALASRVAAEQQQLARRTAEPLAIAEIQIQPLESADSDHQPH